MAVIVGVSAGNLIKSFNWFVYASFALYFANSFFPKGDQTAQLLDAAAVFAVSFMVRPLGAWMIGVYSDRVGRRAGLILSIALMTLGSLALAIIPDQKHIGALAPVLLVLVRVVQGISLGGEYGVSAAYLSEMAVRRHRGMWSSSLGATPIIGQLCGLCLLIVLQTNLSDKALHDWGWRIPFAIGGALSLATLWLRRGVEETTAFVKVAAKPGPSRTLAFLKHPRETGIILVITAGGTLGFYTFTTYMQKFLVNTAGFSKTIATEIMAVALLISVVQHPILGALSDRIGRKPLLIAYSGLTMVLACRTPSTSLVTPIASCSPLFWCSSRSAWSVATRRSAAFTKPSCFPPKSARWAWPCPTLSPAPCSAGQPSMSPCYSSIWATNPAFSSMSASPPPWP